MKFAFETTVPTPIVDVFNFHLHPDNLLLLHTAWGCTRLREHDQTVCTGSITWVEELLWHLVPVAVAIEHTVVPPCCVVDRMVQGPFARFIHVHAFESCIHGTIIRDEFDAKLKWWYGGELATETVVWPRLADMFKRRAVIYQTLAAAGSIHGTD